MMNLAVFIVTTFLTISLFAQRGVSHKSYDELLQKYVDEEGMVDYKGLKADRSKLKSYLSILENNPPQKSWTRDQKLAYWINAYNAFTLELILEHYPVASIKDIGSTIKIPFVSTAWDIKFINIGDEEYDLNNLEHGIIRKEFDEPRIHFALVCAAVSCPKLQNRAYTPEQLDSQLTKAAKEFLANPAKNEFKNSNQATLSKLFNWYGGDFNNNGTLIEYINQYSSTKLSKDADIEWKDYDWALNEQK
ncbi:Protein of unknown function, DUF547 [Ekhidna lutea]|uniref:DUF547 domain-containing protein n=1 Tax=Ekhidna lutea TaxID=447679 RepID=A0A239F754_EKHLU|nr:DUF547 domain-containing protein [Ekhidna lutea]SNS52308.1 Protein of unknown function, DUF547 [Ekhidna lutea]